jgi:hypothetical protein
VGRLLEFNADVESALPDLWSEFATGTLVWRDLTAAEKATRAERRRRLFENSRVPWIVSDVGGLVQAYDDVQDIVSFTRWNKQLFTPKGLSACLRRQSLRGRTGAAALFACFCPAGTPGKRELGQVAERVNSRVGEGFVPLMARLFPGLAGPIWLLMAGQVSLTLFGVGISLGPTIGAGLELFFRGLEAVGLPFGPEHNKYHQLKRARAIKNGPKLCGSLLEVDWQDRLMALTGLKFALRDSHVVPEIVIHPGDYPDVGQLLSDPLGVFGNLAALAGSLLPNAAAYMVNDLVQPMVEDLSRFFGGNPLDLGTNPSPSVLAAMKFIEKGRCPVGNACAGSIEDALAAYEWGAAHFLQANRLDLAVELAAEWVGPTVLTPEGRRPSPIQPSS